MLLLSKGALGAGATALAQGGLAAVVDPADSLDLHLHDTLTAGAGLCDPDAVRDLVSSAPAELARLLALGARFDHDPLRRHELALTREGGHTETGWSMPVVTRPASRSTGPWSRQYVGQPSRSSNTSSRGRAAGRRGHRGGCHGRPRRPVRAARPRRGAGPRHGAGHRRPRSGLDGTVIDDAKIFNDKLRECEDYYNFHRPHGALGGQTLYEKLQAKTGLRCNR